MRRDAHTRALTFVCWTRANGELNTIRYKYDYNSSLSWYNSISAIVIFFDILFQLIRFWTILKL